MSRLATTAAGLFILVLGVAVTSAAEAKEIAAYPSPNVRVASDTTTISFRGIKPKALGRIIVRGSRSGGHKGRLRVHSDGRGVSFIPRKKFDPKEKVTVISKRNTFFGTGKRSKHRYSFVTGLLQPKGWRDEPQVPPQGERPPEWTTYKSFPLLVPKITINTSKPGVANGDIFMAPRTNGPMIVDNDGGLVYYRPGQRVTDFRTQTFRGKPVLTWWRRAQVGKHVESNYAIAGTDYKVIKRFEAGNGYTSDPHEFTMASDTTAYVNSFRNVIMDLSKYGGLKRTPVMDNVAQEVDLLTGQVIWEWHSLGNIRVPETYKDIPSKITRPFDYFHLNSISRDSDGNMLISARHTCALYKINRETGKVMWRMGGKDSDFKLASGFRFCYQHDFRPHPNGTYSIFENGAADGELKPKARMSKAYIFRINQKKKTTALVKTYIHPGNLLSPSQGNTQLLPNGNVFTGWGSLEYCTEFAPDGEVLWDMRYSAAAVTYRCYRSPWTGTPVPGAIGVKSETDGPNSRVWVSWNGDTQVRTWRVLAGNPGNLAYSTEVPRDGFETSIPVTGQPAAFRLVGLDGQGKVLGRSRVNKLGELTR
ncbi:MAG TPA: arylsulfotransferase family protein [Solirubrobacterales bacterium]|nr:arylsulfotransferase family protein [Solirubrobacterales bacterium]HMU25981.1 arylsulfotransferase family protein [Solirubrobacterales bacterium]HMW45320.1 arylsulfotransferase family protein [Solirubrobacterales bacterium]HMX70776.1 arylsulfotransferase family protein [Solirubrobacterales bacterium]HMY24932.1 arylsulfotransferase family protein [Solirubrobacterales bacterium]